MTFEPNPARLGVCYYPEHWPEATWAEDAARMKEAGLHWVRIGEFAWSLLEPDPGRYDWGWMDRAIDGLGAAGLKVVLGTPTATPPKWLVDRMPDMLPVGADGRVRGFGSRRHYDFSHEGYRTESARIAAALAERYGRHEALGAWQIDNEYGCHDTVRAYGTASRHGFRAWLRARYGSVDALNEAWWTNFWSMTYRTFDEVDLPVGAVTEAAPGARLDFARFASDAVLAYHERQVAEIRPRSPGRPITHNGMGFFGDYDAHALGRALDRITWDSYPLGMLEQSPLPIDLKARYARTGHPDLVAFNHDLFRGALAPAGDAPYVPFWVMEQQPGQVNWAPTNPLPAPGAVRLWTHQAFAHGAEVVSYFRWRAAQGAQEHLHAGLLRHDRTPDQGLAEAEASARELRDAGTAPADGAPVRRRGHVALLFDHADLWLGQIQPHAAGWRDWAPWVEPYLALRALGLDVDVLPPDRDLSAYRLVVAPSLTMVDDARAAGLQRALDAGSTLVVGPRSGAYRPDARVHAPAPGALLALTGARVHRVDALRPGTTARLSPREPMLGVLEPAGYRTWADLLEPEASTEVWATYAEAAYGGVAAIAMKRHGDGRCVTVGASLDGPTWGRLLASLALEAGLPVLPLPDGVRVSRHAGRTLVQNFGRDPVTVDLRPVGGPVVEVGGVDVAWVDLPDDSRPAVPRPEVPRPDVPQGVRS